MSIKPLVVKLITNLLYYLLTFDSISVVILEILFQFDLDTLSSSTKIKWNSKAMLSISLKFYKMATQYTKN